MTTICRICKKLDIPIKEGMCESCYDKVTTYLKEREEGKSEATE